VPVCLQLAIISKDDIRYMYMWIYLLIGSRQ